MIARLARMNGWLIVDALALAVIAFVAYRLLVAPRFLERAYPAPRLTYATLSGPPFVLSKHRGRVVFLDFWASWCDPCKASLPMAEAFAYRHPEVDVIPVDVGEPRAVVAEFSANYHLTRVAIDPRGISRGLFQLEGFPTMVVIDPQGRIRGTWPGFNPALQLNMAHALKRLKG
jgi:thiol-disulfide isomerase/thioredoxin